MINQVNTYRAIGVILIFLYHCVYCFGTYKDLKIDWHVQALTSLMWSGVNLFFIASGFINGKNFIFCKSIKQFIINRVARILPLYFLFIFIGIIFSYKGNNFFTLNTTIYLFHCFFIGFRLYKSKFGTSLF